MIPVRLVAGAVSLTGAAGAATGGIDLTGLAAMITSLLGVATFIWTIRQSRLRKRNLDAATAADIIEELRRRDAERDKDAGDKDA